MFRHPPVCIDAPAPESVDTQPNKPCRCHGGSEKLESAQSLKQRLSMSAPAHPTDVHTSDAVEAVVPLIPLVLPLAGAVLIFLLAFIAVSMA